MLSALGGGGGAAALDALLQSALRLEAAHFRAVAAVSTTHFCIVSWSFVFLGTHIRKRVLTLLCLRAAVNDCLR